MTHLSPLITTVVSCGSTYTLSEVSSPTNPQSVQHSGSTNGFLLPNYHSSQNIGCPPISWQVSSSETNLEAHPGLNQP